MAQITYADKVAIETNSVADINQVKDSDMNEIKTVVNTNDTLRQGITGTILWTNPSPTSSFTTQNIALSSSDYDILEIIFKSANNQTNCSSFKILKGLGGLMISTSINFTSNNIYIRGLTRNSDTSYTVSSGYTLGTSKVQNDAVCIPVYVVGYKTGLFS